MRKLPVFVSALLIAVAVTGCDSTDNDIDESEVFIGSWAVVEVSDADGDKTDVFEQGIEEFSAVIEADGTYELTIDFVDPQRPTIPFAGPYEINEGSNNLILTATTQAGTQEISFGYVIHSEDRIDLTLGDQVVENIFGAAPDTYEGTVTFTVERL